MWTKGIAPRQTARMLAQVAQEEVTLEVQRLQARQKLPEKAHHPGLEGLGDQSDWTP